jgi:hypothetical protein
VYSLAYATEHAQNAMLALFAQHGANFTKVDNHHQNPEVTAKLHGNTGTEKMLQVLSDKVMSKTVDWLQIFKSMSGF